MQRFREGFTRLPPVRLLGRRYDEDRRDALRMAHSRRLADGGRTAGGGRGFQFRSLRRSRLWRERDHRRPGLSPRPARRWRRSRRRTWRACAKRAWRRSPSTFPGMARWCRFARGAAGGSARRSPTWKPTLRPIALLIENQLPGIMAAHVEYSAVDSQPASLSSRWITDILRGTLGFHGCVFADDLTMAGAAAFGDVVERARLALAAGCDVLPICNDRRSRAHRAWASRTPTSSPASQARLVRMRGARRAARRAAPLEPSGRTRPRVVAELSSGAAAGLDRGAIMMRFDADLYRRLLETSPEGVVIVDALADGPAGRLRQSGFRSADRLPRRRSARQEPAAAAGRRPRAGWRGTGCARL